MSHERDAAEVLLDVDEAARDAMVPIRHRKIIEAIGRASDIADQRPLRIISGAVLLTELKTLGRGQLPVFYPLQR